MQTKFLFKRPKRQILILYLIIICLFYVLFNRLFFFVFATIITGIITYLNHHFRFPFDLSPVLVFSLFFSREYSIHHSVIYIFLGGVLPMIAAGGSFDSTTVFFLVIRIFTNVLSIFFRPFPAIPVFIFLSILDHLLGTIGSISLFGTNPLKETFNLIIQTGTDLLYIFSILSIIT